MHNHQFFENAVVAENSKIKIVIENNNLKNREVLKIFNTINELMINKNSTTEEKVVFSTILLKQNYIGKILVYDKNSTNGLFINIFEKTISFRERKSIRIIFSEDYNKTKGNCVFCFSLNTKEKTLVFSYDEFLNLRNESTVLVFNNSDINTIKTKHEFNPKDGTETEISKTELPLKIRLNGFYDIEKRELVCLSQICVSCLGKYENIKAKFTKFFNSEKIKGCYIASYNRNISSDEKTINLFTTTSLIMQDNKPKIVYCISEEMSKRNDFGLVAVTKRKGNCDCYFDIFGNIFIYHYDHDRFMEKIKHVLKNENDMNKILLIYYSH